METWPRRRLVIGNDRGRVLTSLGSRVRLCETKTSEKASGRPISWMSDRETEKHGKHETKFVVSE